MERFFWVGPIGDAGGYGAVARNYVRGLCEIGSPPVVHQLHSTTEGLSERDRALVDSLPNDLTREETTVIHADPSSFPEMVDQARNLMGGPVVGCTLAETDRLPADWVAACNLVDELWVPSEFNMLTFARSGVDQHRLRLVPYGLDVANWSPEGPVSPAVPDDVFCFLYSFGFDWRKGFDVLLAAYLQEFTRADPVCLVLKAYDPPMGRWSGTLRQRLAKSVLPHVDLLDPDLPRVLVLDEHVSQEELVALYRRADVYFSAERASGWGMPCMEVMALDGVAAAVDWGGATEFMHPGNSLLIEPGDLIPVDERLASERPEYAGQRWPELPFEAVRATLREAFTRKGELEALGARAGEEIRRDWSAERAAEAILNRNSDPYAPREGLRERLRPQLGLAAESPLADARERLLVAGYEPGSDTWKYALDAHLRAFTGDDPVTLCLLAAPGADAHALGQAVLRHLEAGGHDPDAIPDTLVTVCDPEEALVDERLAAIVEPGSLWPLSGLRVAPRAEALRSAVEQPAGRARSPRELKECPPAVDLTGDRTKRRPRPSRAT